MFTGTYTAIVTPFNTDGSVDYGCLRELMRQQAEAGIAGVVPVGTTGESPTLTTEEHIEVVAKTVGYAVEFASEYSAKRMTVIAGTGANSTQEAVELTSAAREVGADATLQICPYYNKPTAEGLYRHFAAIADLGLPVMLYNAPGRTSREIPIPVVARLAAHPKIVAIKEAAGDANRVNQILAAAPSVAVISGDDSLALPMMSIGATGLVSVASNIVPREMTEMINFALAGDFKAAFAIHERYRGLFADLFIETNPVPVKAALAMMGAMPETYRLPLCEMDPANREKLRATLRKLGLV